MSGSGKFPTSGGFTLIELLVVMAILASLLTLALPRYFGQVDHAKEVVLREDLHVMRDAIEKFQSDKGRYPAQLEELVAQRYLRGIPIDPFTELRSWAVTSGAGDGGVVNIHSLAPGKARDGTLLKDW